MPFTLVHCGKYRTEDKLKTGVRELPESCVSQHSGSVETEQPCVAPRNFATYGQICILSHFLAKMTGKTTYSRRGHASGQNFTPYTCMTDDPGYDPSVRKLLEINLRNFGSVFLNA